MRDDRIARAVAYINENPKEKLKTADLANLACMSVWHFARRFRRATGKTPQQYAREARIDCSKRQLRLGVAIAAVAFTCGFSSQAHLTKAFRLHTGMTPAQYQREQFSQSPE